MRVIRREWIQRRERDSNPRNLRSAVFKTAPFDRSGISPVSKNITLAVRSERQRIHDIMETFKTFLTS